MRALASNLQPRNSLRKDSPAHEAIRIECSSTPPLTMTQTIQGPASSRHLDQPAAVTRGRTKKWPRRLLIGFIVLLALVVVVRIVLDPIAAHYTRKALNGAEGMQSRFDGVHVTVFPPGYEIRQLAVIET